jgi:hypothetical protein
MLSGADLVKSLASVVLEQVDYRPMLLELPANWFGSLCPGLVTLIAGTVSPSGRD